MPSLWVSTRASPGVPTSFSVGIESVLEFATVDPATLPVNAGAYLVRFVGRVSTYSAGTGTVRLRLGGDWGLADGTELVSIEVTANGVITASVEVDAALFVGTQPLKITGIQAGGGTQPQIQEYSLTITAAESEPEPEPEEPEEPVLVHLEAVNVWAADLLELVFSGQVRNNGDLQDSASYRLIPMDGGVPVTIKAVRSGSSITTTRAFLVITPASVEHCYRVVVTGDVLDTNGTALEPPKSVIIKIHRTKVDSMLSTRPGMYDVRPEAVFRNVLNAIAYQDHLIGGNIQICEENCSFESTSGNQSYDLVGPDSFTFTFSADIDPATVNDQTVTHVVSGPGDDQTFTMEVVGNTIVLTPDDYALDTELNTRFTFTFSSEILSVSGCSLVEVSRFIQVIFDDN